MIEKFNRLSEWQKGAIWAMALGLLFGVSYGIISGEWPMAAGGFVIGLVSGPAVYYYLKKRD